MLIDIFSLNTVAYSSSLLLFTQGHFFRFDPFVWVWNQLIQNRSKICSYGSAVEQHDCVIAIPCPIFIGRFSNRLASSLPAGTRLRYRLVSFIHVLLDAMLVSTRGRAFICIWIALRRMVRNRLNFLHRPVDTEGSRQSKDQLIRCTLLLSWLLARCKVRVKSLVLKFRTAVQGIYTAPEKDYHVSIHVEGYSIFFKTNWFEGSW